MAYSFMGLDEGVSKILGEAGFHLSRQGAISLVSGVPVLIRLDTEKGFFALGLSRNSSNIMIESLKISGLSIEAKKIRVADDHVMVPLRWRVLRESARDDARKLLTFLEGTLPGIAHAPVPCSYCGFSEASMAVIRDGKPQAACIRCIENPEVANFVERGISFEKYREGLARFSKSLKIGFAISPLSLLPLVVSLKASSAGLYLLHMY